MRYAILGIATFVLMFCVGSVVAQERGIGVSPSKIEIRQHVEWPYTVPVTVTNLSSETENFEITFEKDKGSIVSVLPGRFSLDAGARARVLVVFDPPAGGETDGLVNVVSARNSPEGFTTGTGVRIPFHIEVQNGGAEFFSAKLSLAGAGAAFGGFNGFHQLFGAGMMLATLILLWYLSDIARAWIFNSGRD